MCTMQVPICIILCAFVRVHGVQTSCAWPAGPVFHPDSQNSECVVIKERRNAVRGSHAASLYRIITGRRREEGCRLQLKQACRVALQLGSRATLGLMVGVGVAA